MSVKNAIKIILPLLFLFFSVFCEKGQEGREIIRNPEFASTYLGGSEHEFCEAIALDSDGNIYVAGYTLSPDFPTTDGVRLWHL